MDHFYSVLKFVLSTNTILRITLDYYLLILVVQILIISCVDLLAINTRYHYSTAVVVAMTTIPSSITAATNGAKSEADMVSMFVVVVSIFFSVLTLYLLDECCCFCSRAQKSRSKKTLTKDQ